MKMNVKKATADDWQNIRATEIESNGAMTTFVITVNGEKLPVMIPMIGLAQCFLEFLAQK